MNPQIIYFLLLIVLTSFHESYCEEFTSNVLTSRPYLNKTNQNIPKIQLINYGFKSYYIGTVFKGNFFQAEQFCRSQDMNLVSITSKNENDFLQMKITQFDSRSQKFWTSGTKLPDAVKWIWFTTGKPLSYTNWDQNQPNDIKDNQCVTIEVMEDHLKWFNVNCWENFYLICEVTWKDCKGRE